MSRRVVPAQQPRFPSGQLRRRTTPKHTQEDIKKNYVGEIIGWPNPFPLRSLVPGD